MTTSAPERTSTLADEATSTAVDLTGTTLPGPPGLGVDVLRAACDLERAESLHGALVIAGRRAEPRTAPVLHGLARLLAAAAPATRAALVARPQAAVVDELRRHDAAPERVAAVAAGLLLGGPDRSTGLVVLVPEGLGAGPVQLAHLHAALRPHDDLPVALASEAEQLRLTWPDGATATLPRGGTEVPACVLGGRLVTGAAAAGWRLLNGLLPSTPADGALPLSAPELPTSAAVLEEGAALLGEVWPEALAAARRHVRALLLLAGDGERTFSYTPRDLSGLVGLTARDPVQVADALVHESSHVRFDLVRRQHDVLDDDGAAIHPAPWRPDPRPLEQVLYGAHAFLNVCLLYRRLVPLFPDAERVWAQQRGDVLAAWAYLRPLMHPTPAGEPLVEEMAACVAQL